MTLHYCCSANHLNCLLNSTNTSALRASFQHLQTFSIFRRPFGKPLLQVIASNSLSSLRNRTHHLSHPTFSHISGFWPCHCTLCNGYKAPSLHTFSIFRRPFGKPLLIVTASNSLSPLRNRTHHHSHPTFSHISGFWPCH